MEESLEHLNKIFADLPQHGGGDSVEEQTDSTTVIIRTPEVIKVRKKIKGAIQKEFRQIVELAVARENIYMYGPTGSGKTFLAEKTAEALELPFFAQSVSQGMDETVVTGRILPGADGWGYQASNFVKFYETGGVYCLDEIDKADPNLLTFLNTALSNDFFYNELEGGKRVSKHEDFVLIATANSAGHGGSNSYFGEELDLSTLRRFQTGMIEIGYDTKLEKKLLSTSVFLWGQLMRKVIDELGTERLVVSTGFLMKVDKMSMNFGWKRKRWEESFFAGRKQEEIKRIRNLFKRELASVSESVVSDEATPPTPENSGIQNNQGF